jgi:HEPN domain-containing protein
MAITTLLQADQELEEGTFIDYFFQKYSSEAVSEKLAQFSNGFQLLALPAIESANVELDFLQEVKYVLEKVRIQTCRSDVICTLTPSFSEQTLVSLEGVVTLIKQAIPVGVIYNLGKVNGELDLIVVLEKSCTKPYTAYEHVVDLALLGYENGTCTIHNYGLLNAQLMSGHLFYSSVCIEENVVYRKNTSEIFGYASPEIVEEIKIKSANVFSAGITKAINFYQGAQQYLADELYEMAIFMLQQACELTYRCLLNVLRGKDLKCHSPIVLRKHIRRFAPEIIGIFSSVEEEEIQYLQVLEEAYIKSRYQIDYTIERDLLFFLNGKVAQLQDWAKVVFERVIST